MNSYTGVISFAMHHCLSMLDELLNTSEPECSILTDVVILTANRKYLIGGTYLKTVIYTYCNTLIKFHWKQCSNLDRQMPLLESAILDCLRLYVWQAF